MANANINNGGLVESSPEIVTVQLKIQSYWVQKDNCCLSRSDRSPNRRCSLECCPSSLCCFEVSMNAETTIDVVFEGSAVPLANLCYCLSLFSVAKVIGGTPNKLFKIKVVRLSIAQVLTVISHKQKAALMDAYKNKKYFPLDLRPKKTRAIRKRLTKHQVKCGRIPSYVVREWGLKVVDGGNGTTDAGRDAKNDRRRRLLVDLRWPLNGERQWSRQGGLVVDRWRSFDRWPLHGTPAKGHGSKGGPSRKNNRRDEPPRWSVGRLEKMIVGVAVGGPPVGGGKGDD
ncbi:hypothetical protein V8G54_024602 [Vigna mungo]|uniref:60S ribosomal protein L35 n=1 Tax=Vigna mungo TaxID=3915 RepID=A0AAQ3RTL8_VIGMU